MDINLASIALLCITGFFAGAINTVAGGGSNLTLPVLMMLGLPHPNSLRHRPPARDVAAHLGTAQGSAQRPAV